MNIPRDWLAVQRQLRAEKSGAPIPSIRGTWREDPQYDPTRYDRYIRIVQPDGSTITRAVDRQSYERVLSLQLQRRLEQDAV